MEKNIKESGANELKGGKENSEKDVISEKDKKSELKQNEKTKINLNVGNNIENNFQNGGWSIDDNFCEEDEEDEDFAGEDDEQIENLENSAEQSEIDDESEISEDEDVDEEEIIDLYEEAKALNDDFLLTNENDDSFTYFEENKPNLKNQTNNIQTQSSTSDRKNYMLRRKRKNESLNLNLKK